MKEISEKQRAWLLANTDLSNDEILKLDSLAAWKLIHDLQEKQKKLDEEVKKVERKGEQLTLEFPGKKTRKVKTKWSEENRAVCITAYIKASTKSCIKILAEANGVTPSLLISDILDDYVMKKVTENA